MFLGKTNNTDNERFKLESMRPETATFELSGSLILERAQSKLVRKVISRKFVRDLQLIVK